MTDTNTLAFASLCVQSITAIIIALGGPWFALRMAQLNKNMKMLEQNTNSIKDELVRVTKVSAHAEGVLAEKTRQEMKP